MFTLEFTDESKAQLAHLKGDKSLAAPFKAVTKALQFLQTDPRHNSLQSKRYHSLKGPDGERVFESYAQQHTPGAYRIFWYYHSSRKVTLVILNIVRHP
ncbi:MAG: hypothetical protein IID14_10045 [Candidatus Marinimicrobia bacterium]|nr:hypothetical protein [Candidatus Neomarinimicrobiota bacterium]